MGGSFEDTRNTKSTVNPSECRRMVNTKADPQGGKFERIRDGQFGTKKSPDGDWTWPHHITIYVINYFYVALTLVISNEDETTHPRKVNPSAPLDPPSPYYADFELLNERGQIYPSIPITRSRCSSCSKRGSRSNRASFKVRRQM